MQNASLERQHLGAINGPARTAIALGGRVPILWGMTSSPNDSPGQAAPAGPVTMAKPPRVRRVPLPIGVLAWLMLGGAAAYGVWLYGAHRALHGQSLGAMPWVCIMALIAITGAWEFVAYARKQAKAAAKQDEAESARYGGAEQDDDGSDASKKEQPDLNRHPNATRVGFQTGTRLWMRMALLMAIGAGLAGYTNASALADGAAAHGDWFIAAQPTALSPKILKERKPK